MKNKPVLISFFMIISLFMTGCQPNPSEVNQPKETHLEPDLAILAEEIIELGSYPEMLSISGTRLSKFYDIDAEQLESFAVYLCAEAIRSDEIILLRAKDVKEVEDLQKKVEARLTAQKKSFDDYLPKEGEKIGKVIFYKSHKDLLFVITESKYIEELTTHIERAYQSD